MDENYLLNDRAVKLSTAKVYVFSDSVLCLGKIIVYSRSINSWKDKIEWFTQSSEYRESGRIDGEPVEFECEIFHDTHIREIQRKMEENKILPEQFEERLRLGESRKQRNLFVEFLKCCVVRQKMS